MRAVPADFSPTITVSTGQALVDWWEPGGCVSGHIAIRNKGANTLHIYKRISPDGGSYIAQTIGPIDIAPAGCDYIEIDGLRDVGRSMQVWAQTDSPGFPVTTADAKVVRIVPV